MALDGPEDFIELGHITLTPYEFIQKWQNSKLKERSAAQEHFIDLCRLLSEATPAETDPTGKDYGFEVGASKTTGGNGFADVFKRGHFAWEYKGPAANLDTAFAQLQRYAVALDNPPLLIVSDIGTNIRIHTNWTNSVSKIYEIAISDMQDSTKLGWLKSAFSNPVELQPKKTRQELTEEVAGEFARLARSLRERGHPPEQVAHFVNRLVFCMFAEDVRLLPDSIFTRMLERAIENPEEFESFAALLFAAMKSGGRVGFEKVSWFNGGLFDDETVFSLTKDEIKIVHRAASQYWGDIDPSIFGTLFERGLDPQKRSQLGAHYTDREKIMTIINPVVVEPLMAEWDASRSQITALMEKADSSSGAPATRAKNRAQRILDDFLSRLATYRVLDPACGSGNFLYLALSALKNLEHRAQVEAEALGLPRSFPQIGPEVVRGIEINPYAAELARVSIWIGEIQWMLRNGFAVGQNPILKPLNQIECRDALISSLPEVEASAEEWTVAAWPKADAIIGNPPFLGSRKLQPELGSEYVQKLRRAYGKAVPDGADLVTYWFFKAGNALNGGTDRIGLVATNSIADGKSRTVLADAAEKGRIFYAWSDQPWTIDGASVRVAIVCISAKDSEEKAMLDGETVDFIFPDLTARKGNVGVDLTKARKLSENRGVAFQGIVPRGSLNRKDAERLELPPASFLLDQDEAREVISVSGNPNGKCNSEVVVPYLIGQEVVKRPMGRCIVDFFEMAELDASFYEEPFKRILPVKAHRAQMNQKEALETWWRQWNARPAMRKAIAGKHRYIATPRVSKHRVFRWVNSEVLADNMIIAIARSDDVTFGILQSKFHELWSLRMCSYLGVGNDPRYTPSTTFETFPFPEEMRLCISTGRDIKGEKFDALASAASELNRARELWLNPKELTGRKIDTESGIPMMETAIDDEAEKALRKRTLTNLYNQRPEWLNLLHKNLDEAVATVYGWDRDIGDDDAISALLALNLDRSGLGA